jgi:glycine cleavage system transcriptional repressor
LKPEIRNQKSESMSNDECLNDETFGHSSFGHSSLIRISGFGFRVSRAWQYNLPRNRLPPMAQLIITAVGPDRPGLVGELTAHLHSRGANLLDSRMVNLRGQFAMLVLLEAEEDSAGAMSRDLSGFGKSIGLALSVTSQGASAQSAAGLRFKLKTYSLDQPGIVAKLTGVLRGHGVNIEELSAWQESAAFAGSPLFLTEMQLTVPPNVPVRQLRSDLETLCNQLNCDVDLEPAEG